MELHDKIATAIYKAIDDVNAQLPASKRLSKGPDTVLFGRDQGLDSLSLTNLIVALERHIEKAFGKSVSLSAPEILLRPENPFSDVRSLGVLLESLLKTD